MDDGLFTPIGVTIREPSYPFAKIPTFGFETKSLRAIEKITELVDKVINKYKTGGPSEQKSYTAAVEKAGSEENFRQSQIDKAHRGSNVGKILGYIPVVGILVGLGRISSTAKDKEIFSKKEYVRAAIETLGLGILLLPVDIAVTGYRHRQWKKMQAEI
ncbi:MAG: hypothetical protein ACK5MA_05420 [Parachlamydiaceae bacterium]